MLQRHLLEFGGTAQYCENGRHQTPRYNISMTTNATATYMEVAMTILCCGRTIVIRLYIMSRHALTSHMVRSCICSTTKTSLDPYIRILISASEY